MKSKLILLIIFSALFSQIALGERLIEYSKTTEISNSSESVVDQASQSIYKVVVSEKNSVLDGIYEANSHKNSLLIETNASHGTGFLIAEDLLLTDEHVVKDNKTVLVIPASDSTKIFYGEVVSVDKNLDLAIIKIPKQEYKVLKFGDSAGAGNQLISLGFSGNKERFPQKLEITGHEGKVLNFVYSMTGYNNTLRGVIETDSEHGMSGGPIININGEVVGTVDFLFDDKTTGYTMSDDIKTFIQAYTDSIIK